MATKKEVAHKREILAQLMDYMAEEEHLIFYPNHDVRVKKVSDIKWTPTKLEQVIQAHQFIYDCSQTVEILCLSAGLNWPLSMRNGYTGTILKGLQNYHNALVAQKGAIVVFGPYPGHHVATVRVPGKNPTLFSHGANMNAHMISLSTEQRFQPSPHTFCSIASLF